MIYLNYGRPINNNILSAEQTNKIKQMKFASFFLNDTITGGDSRPI